MIKNYFTFLIAFLTGAVLPAQTLLLPLLKDSMKQDWYDLSTGMINDEYNSVFKYGADNQLLEISGVRNSIWTGLYQDKEEYTYNAEKLLSSHIISTNGSGAWENIFKTEYSYDLQKRPLLELHQLPNTSGAWENDNRRVFGYDDAAHTDSVSSEQWNYPLPGWNNSIRYIYHYLPSGEIKESFVRRWDEEELEWVPLDIYRYTYRPDGKLQIFEKINYYNTFTSFTRDSFIYRLDGKVDSVLTLTDIPGQGFLNNSISTSEYDSEDRLVANNYFIRSSATAPWRLFIRNTYEPGDGYYSNDPVYEAEELRQSTGDYELTREVFRQYTPLGDDRVLYRQEQKEKFGPGATVTQKVDSTWYRLGTVATGAPLARGTADCQFANPFRSGNCIVCNSKDENSLITIQLTNISGQPVAQALVMPGDSWRPGANMPAGSYFLTAWQNGKYLGQKQMVVR